jgi:hypothetical protein
VDRAVVAVEAAGERPVVLRSVRRRVPRHVPLADGIALVARGPQRLGNRHAPAVQIAAIAVEPLVLHHVSDAGLVRRETGQERGPRGAAASRIIELREPQSAGGKLIEIGRVDLAAVAADVGETHVVGEDHDDIGSGGRLGAFRKSGAQQQCNCDTEASALEGELHRKLQPGTQVRSPPAYTAVPQASFTCTGLTVKWQNSFSGLATTSQATSTPRPPPPTHKTPEGP